MRISEAICVIFLCIFLAQGLFRSLKPAVRLRIIGLGIAGMTLIWLGMVVPVLRDWVPAILLLFVYWQGGSFFTQPNQRLQAYLQRCEEQYFSRLPLACNLYWEVAYFFCYPLVPGAVAVLYSLELQQDVDFFWTVVLPPTMLCHLVVSFYQTYPPWKFLQNGPGGIVRRLNFLVIRHASIQLNTFPSAHVAASMAAAFAMLHLSVLAGIVFLFLAISITASTVIGRYHYGADAVYGIFLALGWFAIVLLI